MLTPLPQSQEPGRPDDGKAVRNNPPVPRMGQVYLDARNRRLLCLNETARQLYQEGVPFKASQLADAPLQTLAGETVTANEWPLMVALREGHNVEAAFLLTRVGKPTCQVTWNASPVKDAAGQLLGVLASVCCHPPEPDWKSMLGLAHDLRTPMQALTLLLTVLDNPKLTEAQQREALEQVRVTAERALGIGNDLLEWTTSAAQRGRGVEPAWFPLQPLLKQLASEQSVAAKRKGLKLTTQLVDVEAWEVYTDRVRLGRLLANLLVNAVRYTQMGAVEFAAGWRPDPAGEVLDLSIVDTGVGISTEEQESIFQPFARGRAGKEDSSGDPSSGSGLGLAVVDQLKDELGLTLEVYSEFGRGSTFHLLFPPNLLRKAPRPHDTDVSIQTAKMKP